MKPARWVCSETALRAGLALLLSMGLVAAHAQSGDVGVLKRLDRAEFVQSDATEPPPDSAPWKPQTLPDYWGGSRPGVEGYGWYRLSVDLPRQPDEPFAVYTPVLRTIGTIYMNGALLGRTDPPGTIAQSRWPQYFVVPPSTLHVGANQLQIRVFAVKEFRNGLTPVLFGVDALVRPEFEQRLFWQVTGAQFSSALAAIFGVIALLLSWRRRGDPLYAYFGLSSLSWAIYLSFYFVRYPPLSAPWWGAIVFAAGNAKLLFMSLFALRYAEFRWPRVERGLWIWFAVTVAVIYVSNVRGNSFWLFDQWERSYQFVLVFYACVLAVAAWRRPTVQNVFVALTVAIHPIVQLILDFVTLPEQVFVLIAPYDFLPMQLLIGWILVDRFAHALNEAETLNTELEQRVLTKHAELEQQFERTRELEREQAVVKERVRIMSDMHDGIGGQLISTLGLVEHGEGSPEVVASALRECIDDLRLAIDSLEPADDDLLPVLGGLRYRLESRLKQQGIALDWQVQDVPKLACLTPQNVLHVLRILQEAFTNVLKHAKASRIRVATRVEQGMVSIDVSDNGHGFDGGPAGYGLANMRRRAQAVGGELLVQPSSSGTTLSLLLPVR